MFGNESILFLDKKLVVIPLNGKRPYLKNWQQTTLNDLTDEFIEDHHDANIGILLGETNNIVAVDIDKEDAISLCPPSPVRKKGKKGETRFFKFNGEKNSKRHDLGLELLSTGNQTVLPPSVHPETNKPYFWITPDTLPDFDADDLPILPQDFLNLFNEQSSQSSGEGRNSTLFKVACAMIDRNESVENIVNEIYNYDLAIHPSPYFLDKSETHGGLGKQSALKMVQSWIKTAQSKGADYLKIESVERSAPEATKRIWKKLPKLPGIGQEIFDDIYSLSAVPRTQFSFIHTLNLISAISGNKLSLEGVQPNLYIYCVAPSQAGKDFPMVRVKEYLYASQIDCIGSSDLTSDSVIRKQLQRNRSQCFYINEAEVFLKRINSPRDNRGVIECITQVFDMPGRTMSKKTTVSKTNDGVDDFGQVFSPYVGLCFSSTDTAFNKHISIENFETGLFSRILLVFEDRHRERRVRIEATPALKPDILKYMAAINSAGNIYLDADTQSRIEIPKIDLYKKLDDHYVEGLMYLNDELSRFRGHKFVGAIGRKVLYFKKFIILHHIMTHPFSYLSEKVSLESVDWALEAVNAIYHNMLNLLDENVSSSDYGRLSNKMLRYLQKNGPKEKKKMSARFRDIPKPVRDRVIQDLLEQEAIMMHDGKLTAAKG